MVRVGQLRNWDRPRGWDGNYTYFLVIGERMASNAHVNEKRFTVRYPDGTTQEYRESDLMPGFNEVYDSPDGYSSVEVGNEQG